MLLLNNLKYILVIALLIFFQVAIFNNINIWGYANPYFYVIFVLLYPLNKNRYIFLIYAFILGLSIDFFENTGGVNAFATVFVAYIRFYVAKILTANNIQENDEVRLYNFNFLQWTIYLVSLIFLHHFLVDFMESFKINMAASIAFKATLGAAITLVLVGIYLIFFPIVGKSEY